MVCTGVLVVWVRTFSLMLTKLCWKGALSLIIFAESRTVFVPKTSHVVDHGRIIRSLTHFSPLTVTAKLLTSAICRGLHWYTMRCIHPSQRCISSREMTDSIVEIETTALAHLVCAPEEFS